VRRAWQFSLVALGAGLAGGTLGCGPDGIVPSTGALEPIQVNGGQFFDGPLPVGTAGPKVQTISAPSTVLVSGQSGWNVSGDVDIGAYSVALAFTELGTGYWIVPVGEPDVQVSGALVWSAGCSFAWSIPTGSHDLAFSAIDGTGQAGPANPLTLNFQSPVPAGAVVVSLTWDSNADLDLHLVAPDGAELDPQHPNTYAGSDGKLPPGTAVLDRDSNGGCVEDGYREEDAVFADAPAPGTYTVRVDMASACGAPSADFLVTVRVHGEVKQTIKGLLLAQDADGGGPGSGLFVTQLSF
jgi:hypothetical protein